MRLYTFFARGILLLEEPTLLSDEDEDDISILCFFVFSLLVRFFQGFFFSCFFVTFLFWEYVSNNSTFNILSTTLFFPPFQSSPKIKNKEGEENVNHTSYGNQRVVSVVVFTDYLVPLTKNKFLAGPFLTDKKALSWSGQTIFLRIKKPVWM